MSAQQSREKFIRQWTVFDCIRGRVRGITIQELLKATGASKATIYRDLDQLLAMPTLPILKELVNGEVRYRLAPDGYSLPRVSPKQIRALVAARADLTGLEGTSVVREIDALLRLGLPGIPPSVAAAEVELIHDPRHAQILEQARDAERAVLLRYRDAQQRDSERRVEPVGLRLYARQLYVIAWDVAKLQLREFKVARILEVTQLQEGGKTHPPFDPDELFAHSLGIWSGRPVEVRIRLAREKAPLIKEYPLSPEARVVPQRDGSVIIEAVVAGLVEVRGWVLRWGRYVEVLAPQGLRELVHEEHLAAARLYERGGGPVS